MNENIQIFPLGDTGLTVEFAAEISRHANDLAISLADLIEEDPFPGFVECLPAYASTTVFFDPIKVSRHGGGGGSFAVVRSFIQGLIQRLQVRASVDGRLHEIPARFDKTSGPDLEHIAEVHQLDVRDVVEIFTSRVYHVYMLGFLPGFSYLGDVDERIATPRRATPRTNVPAGSIGIAGNQAGIYSLASPGGWQIIGRTDVELFTPGAEKITLLEPGDSVRFVEAG